MRSCDSAEVASETAWARAEAKRAAGARGARPHFVDRSARQLRTESQLLAVRPEAVLVGSLALDCRHVGHEGTVGRRIGRHLQPVQAPLERRGLGPHWGGWKHEARARQHLVQPRPAGARPARQRRGPAPQRERGEEGARRSSSRA